MKYTVNLIEQIRYTHIQDYVNTKTPTLYFLFHMKKKFDLSESKNIWWVSMFVDEQYSNVVCVGEALANFISLIGELFESKGWDMQEHLD